MPCSRLHYVTHRLALGYDGLRELVAVEKRVLGHSEFSDSSNLAVFAVPTLEFEDDSQIGSALTHMNEDAVVQKHLQVCSLVG
jgi:hypothetical protein